MTYVHYHSSRSRSRERSPRFADEEDYYTSPPSFVRRDSKRRYEDLYDLGGDDEGFDDYPKSNSKSSRALTIRQPSQLEKYNVWSRPSLSPSPSSTKYVSKYYRPKDDCDSDDDRRDRTVRYKYTTARYSPSPRARSDDEVDDSNEREFRLKVKASFGRPKSSHSERKTLGWTGDVFRRKEKFEDEGWETRERERRDSFFDESLKEKTFRFRKVKRTKTEEWKPLSGWRRS